MLVVWGALVVAGFTIKGLIWLVPLGIVPFFIAGAFSAMETAHPAPLTTPVERAVPRRGHHVRRGACRESFHPAFRKRHGTHRAAQTFGNSLPVGVIQVLR
jgi:hypothetical protein